MDKLVTALAPVFAAGFAVQQFLEIVTSILNLDTKPSFQNWKKVILGIVSIGIGLFLAFEVDALRVLQPLFVDAGGKITANISPFWDHVVTAFVISAGTEGVNSILKFMKYGKEDKKNDAAKATAPTVGAARVVAIYATQKDAMAAMNRK